MTEKTNYYVLKEKAVPDVLLRVVEAKRLLEETDFSVSAVAEKVGYLSRAQFYRNFQAYFGCLPSEIIKKI